MPQPIPTFGGSYQPGTFNPRPFGNPQYTLPPPVNMQGARPVVPPIGPGGLPTYNYSVAGPQQQAAPPQSPFGQSMLQAGGQAGSGAASFDMPEPQPQYSGPPTIGQGSGVVGGMPNMLMNLVGMANRATPPQSQSSGGLSLQQVQNIVNQANRPNLPPQLGAQGGPSVQSLLGQAANPQNPMSQLNSQFGGQMPSMQQWMQNIDQFRPFTTPGLEQYVSNHAANPGNTGQLYAGLANSYIPYLQTQLGGEQAATQRAGTLGNLGLGLGNQAIQSAELFGYGGLPGALQTNAMRAMSDVNRTQQQFSNNLYTAAIGAMMQNNPGVPMPQLMDQLRQQGMPPPVGSPGGPGMNQYTGGGGMTGQYTGGQGQQQGQGQPAPGYLPATLQGQLSPQHYQNLQSILAEVQRTMGTQHPGANGAPGTYVFDDANRNQAIGTIVQRAYAAGVPFSAINNWLGNQAFNPQQIEAYMNQQVGGLGGLHGVQGATLQRYLNDLRAAGVNVPVGYGRFGSNAQWSTGAAGLGGLGAAAYINPFVGVPLAAGALTDSIYQALRPPG